MADPFVSFEISWDTSSLTRTFITVQSSNLNQVGLLLLVKVLVWNQEGTLKTNFRGSKRDFIAATRLIQVTFVDECRLESIYCHS